MERQDKNRMGIAKALSSFRTPTSAGTKRPSLARMIEMAGEEEHAEKLKPSIKRRRRMGPAIETPIRNCNERNSLDSNELGYETDCETSDSEKLGSEVSNDGPGYVGSDGLIRTNLINFDSDDGEDSDSSIEDEANEDSEKVWGLIARRSCVKNCDVLSSFNFFVKLCRALKEDRTLRTIMKTIQNARDKYGMKLKEAVDYSVNKKKDLINNIIDSECTNNGQNNEESSSEDSSNDASDSDPGDIDSNATESDGHHTEEKDNDSISSSDIPDNDEDIACDATESSDIDSGSSDTEDCYDDKDEIWEELNDDAAKFDVDILEIVASYIRICPALKHDPVYQAVMETVDYAMDINEEKTFNDALDFVIQKRQFLILKAAEEATRVACKEGKTWAIASTEDDDGQEQ